MKNIKTLWGLHTAICSHMQQHPEHSDLDVKFTSSTVYVITSTGEMVIIATL